MKGPFVFILLTFQFIAIARPEDSNSKDNIFDFQKKSFSVKTDFLQICNLAINFKSGQTASISGEFNFNELYGLQLNAGLKTLKGKKTEDGFSIGTEFKRYLWYDCYSGLHVGPYCDFQFSNIRVVDKNNNYDIRYKESRTEGGIAAGYLLLIKDHWIIDPTARIGYANINNNRAVGTETIGYNVKQSEMAIGVFLEIGYRF